MMGETLVSPREAQRFCGGLSSSTIYRLIARGSFPKPVVLSRKRNGRPCRVAFVRSELEDYVARVIASNRGGADAET